MTKKILLGITVLLVTTLILRNVSTNARANKISLASKTPILTKLDLPKEPLEQPQKEVKISEIRKTIVLEASNTLVLRGVISEDSVAKTQIKLLELSRQLPADAIIYLVLDTPGGSVTAGLDLIDHVSAIPQKVQTITLFAASMGFQIVQELGHRMIVNQGTLMSHRATVGGMDGQIDGEFETRVAALKRQIQYLDYLASKRMGMDISSYRKLIKDEYWVHGFDAIQEKAADEVINLNCAVSMSGTSSEDIQTLFGNVNVTYSNCPLIKAPLKIDFLKVSSEDIEEVRKAVNMSIFNKSEFVEKYILTHKHQEIFGK